MIINRAIVHKLDKSIKEPVFNDFELDVNCREYSKILEKILRKLINNSKLRTCKFNNFDENIIRLATEETLYYNDKFKENSKVIARKLFNALDLNDSNDFLLMLYTHKDKQYIAGICMSYSKSLLTEIHTEEDKVKIELLESTKAHKPNQKIMYGFSCGVSGRNDEWNLLVLDVDSEKYETDSKIARFFADAEKTNSSRYLTQKFINITTGWISNLSIDDIGLAKSLYEDISYLMTQSYEMEYLEFANKYINEPLLREAFILLMQEREIPTKFDIDNTIGNRKLKNTKLKTLSGIKISIKTDDFLDPTKFSFKRNDNGSIDIVIKNIEKIEL